jgi:hypothetical protein
MEFSKNVSPMGPRIWGSVKTPAFNLWYIVVQNVQQSASLFTVHTNRVMMVVMLGFCANDKVIISAIYPWLSFFIIQP